ncbi:MAG: dihydroxyacetone kinase subunit L [Finegoldia sp.]|nr:dihydroxyacetone kinase subunit L [Finegoldia sp.]
MPINSSDFSIIIKIYIGALNLDRQLLNRLDKNLSNGDHGDKICKGLANLFEIYPNFASVSLSEQFYMLSRIFNDEMEGSMGKIYGYTFYRLSEDLVDVDDINRQRFAKLLDKACAYIKRIGDCELGDKTVLDAVEVAGISLRENIGLPITRLLNRLVADTKVACDRTALMSPKKYRSTFSAGTVDPGAYSFYLFMDSIYKFYIKSFRRR